MINDKSTNRMIKISFFPVRKIRKETLFPHFFSSSEDIIEALRGATDRGVIIINISQCPRGEVAATYAVR